MPIGGAGLPELTAAVPKTTRLIRVTPGTVLTIASASAVVSDRPAADGEPSTEVSASTPGPLPRRARAPAPPGHGPTATRIEMPVSTTMVVMPIATSIAGTAPTGCRGDGAS